MRMGGKVKLKTVSGDTITVQEKGGKWMVLDETGKSAMIETADVLQANGNVFVIDTVLMPKM